MRDVFLKPLNLTKHVVKHSQDFMLLTGMRGTGWAGLHRIMG